MSEIDTDVPIPEFNQRVEYSDDQVKAFVTEAEEWLISGQPLKRWCDKPGKPNWVTFWRWQFDRVPELRNILARAREAGSWLMHDEIIDIADDSSGDTKTITTKSGIDIDVCDTEFVQRSRVRIEARLKLMAINNRAVFGEKAVVDHTHTGSVEITAIQSEIIDAEPLQITKVENIVDDD